MNVFAFSTPRRPEWRWRIVNYAGEIVEESSLGFSTIALAVADGTKRMRDQRDRELSNVGRVGGRASWPRRK